MRYERIHLKELYPFLGEDGRDPVLSCYLPDNLSEIRRENQMRPTLLICPGGAYKFCSTREEEPIAFHFLPEGYNVFVLTYSVNPHRFPVQVLEVAASFDYMTKNAESLHCDMTRTAILGFSAGGHLAANYVAAVTWQEVTERFPNPHRVAACLLSYPVITADPAVSHELSFEYLLGEYPQGEKADRFSLEKQVNADTPPTFLWHTAEDKSVPVQNTLLYAMALAKYKVPFELHVYPFGCHGLATADDQTNNGLPTKTLRPHQWLQRAREWLAITL